MIRKKITIKSKDVTGVQNEKPPAVVRTYQLNKKSKDNTVDRPTIDEPMKTYLINNLVKLSLTSTDLNLLEHEMKEEATILLKDVEQNIVPQPWNGAGASGPALVRPVQTMKETLLSKSPFKSVMKSLTIKTPKPKSTRKDLIISSGIKRQTMPIMKIFSQGWPSHSSHACWYCCHKFNQTPVGIPHMLNNAIFHCYGNFCSYNCAKKYLNPRSEDDIAMLQTAADVSIEDDKSEKLQLLELLYHIETQSPLSEPIKPASSRLTLSMFGGPHSIEEFRFNFKTHNTCHTFRSPLVPISYQMEECSDTKGTMRKRQVSLDTLKIEKAFNELAAQSAKKKATVRKLLFSS